MVETKPEPRIATIADNQIVHRGLLEKGSGAPLLREMIGIAAERLMQFETEAVCGAAPRERSAVGSTSATAPACYRRAPKLYGLAISLFPLLPQTQAHCRERANRYN